MAKLYMGHSSPTYHGIVIDANGQCSRKMCREKVQTNDVNTMEDQHCAYFLKNMSICGKVYLRVFSLTCGLMAYMLMRHYNALPFLPRCVISFLACAMKNKLVLPLSFRFLIVLLLLFYMEFNV
jgi:hypothetical protein